MMKLLLLVVCFVPPWLGSLVKEVLLLGEVTATGTRRQATTAYMLVLSLPPADTLYMTMRGVCNLLICVPLEDESS